MKSGFAVAAALLAAASLGGCSTEDLGSFAEAMTYMNDDTNAQNGQGFPDQHFSDVGGDGDCGYRIEYGVANNRGYVRLTNTGAKMMNYKVTWDSGNPIEGQLGSGDDTGIIQKPAGLNAPRHVEYGCPKD